MAQTGRGWAVVERSSWAYINQQLNTIQAIRGCRTWGDYRQLEVADDTLIELVYQETGAEPGVDPPDDTPFGSQLNYEDYERDAWLQRATTDLFESIDDDSFPWDCLDVTDIWTVVEDEHIAAVVRGLEERGFHVSKVDE